MNFTYFHAHRIIWYLLALLLFSVVGEKTVSAQSILERLENQIRERVSPSQDNSSLRRSPAVPPRARQSPANQPFVSPPAAVHQPHSIYLGVIVDDRNDRGRGVRITDIHPGGPAEKAGLHKQDLITALSAVRIRQLSDLMEMLAFYHPNDVVEFDILRDYKPQKIKVTLSSRPATTVVASQGVEVIPLPQGELLLPQPPPEQSSQASPAGVLLAEPRREKEGDKIELMQKRIIELEQRVADLERALSEARKK
ncbi:MAG TPA: PDZ domain-containing protein [Thermoguttaceae bacterium]